MLELLWYRTCFMSRNFVLSWISQCCFLQEVLYLLTPGGGELEDFSLFSNSSPIGNFQLFFWNPSFLIYDTDNSNKARCQNIGLSIAACNKTCLLRRNFTFSSRTALLKLEINRYGNAINDVYCKIYSFYPLSFIY